MIISSCYCTESLTLSQDTVSGIGVTALLLCNHCKALHVVSLGLGWHHDRHRDIVRFFEKRVGSCYVYDNFKMILICRVKSDGLPAGLDIYSVQCYLQNVWIIGVQPGHHCGQSQDCVCGQPFCWDQAKWGKDRAITGLALISLHDADKIQSEGSFVHRENMACWIPDEHKTCALRIFLLGKT